MSENSTSSFSEGAEPRAPLVLIIDDEDQTPFSEVLQDLGVDAVYLAPDDLEESLLHQAATVVVDQYLDHWPGRNKESVPLALRVPDGLSLASVLRSRVEGSGDRQGPPQSAVSFVLRTGEVETIGAGLPSAARQHLLAAQYNLEWVFEKGSVPVADTPSTAQRIAELARATASLPDDWSAGTGDPGIKWLRLPDAEWTDDARWQVEQCRPPQHVVAQRTAGRAWLRWFLQRVLPYPTFLVDVQKVAVMFGITVSAAEEVLSSSTKLGHLLEEARYNGPLNSFMGKRWWRAGVSFVIERILAEHDLDDDPDPETIAAVAATIHGSKLERLSVPDPVLEIGSDYSTARQPISAKDAVRLQPDDWPPYADEAWASRSRLNGDDPELLALVVSTDRWRLHSPPSDSLNDDDRASGVLSEGGQ
ncbi:hypothetical protein ABZU25_04775 [Micromonospora sp. NPDC005215]|uniref:hypothetical protein n=1 Tax=Micromonospora sp. NPDC005215 TaxID=3157024 RepID=UPI0033BB8603